MFMQIQWTALILMTGKNTSGIDVAGECLLQEIS